MSLFPEHVQFSKGSFICLSFDCATRGATSLSRTLTGWNSAHLMTAYGGVRFVLALTGKFNCVVYLVCSIYFCLCSVTP